MSGPTWVRGSGFPDLGRSSARGSGAPDGSVSRPLLSPPAPARPALLSARGRTLRQHREGRDTGAAGPSSPGAPAPQVGAASGATVQTPRTSKEPARDTGR